MPLKVILFVLATIGIAWVSRSSLRDLRSHGFYRFFAWEAILILFLLNVNHWFRDPFHPRQILSWILLIFSLVLVVEGVRTFHHQGKIDPARADPTLVGIEKTTVLVTTGVYHYIRHPFYSSLLFLGWGIFLKRITWITVLLAAVTTAFLIMTARKEEDENLRYFGEPYRAYMHKTKRFIPYLF